MLIKKGRVRLDGERKVGRSELKRRGTRKTPVKRSTHDLRRLVLF